MGNVNEAVSLEVRGDIALVRIDSPPVNALGRSVRDGIVEAVRRARGEPQVRALVLLCSGKTFIAGADIRELGKPPEGALLPEVLSAIEDSEQPVIAAIHGTALGGGLEVALACHYRVAVPSAKLGLPEVKLGLLPGAGGTQRLPRLVGVEKALEMMIGGDPITAADARAHGLLDELLDGELEAGAFAFAERVVREGLPRRKVREERAKLDEMKNQPELFIRWRKSLQKKSRGMPAPEQILSCIEAAVHLSFDEGLRFERRAFLELMSSAESKAQRYYFFAEREAAKVPDVSADTPKRAIAKVGIVGAGTMGGGIAMNFLNAGKQVVIVETKKDALDRGVAVIRKNYERTASKGKLTAADVEQRMGLLLPTLQLDDVRDCDLVIEAVFEDMAVKQDVFGRLDRVCKPGAILATNTSYLNVDEIAAFTSRPGDVIGLHFFSPANVMKLLEVVRGRETKKDVIATALSLGKSIGKIGVLVGVCRGFVGNRMLAARRDQAQQLLAQGAMPWDVDRVLEGFGMPMGPFAMGDLAGLDIGWDAQRSQGETVLRDKLCELGRRGQKTGAGYYSYDPQTRERRVDPVVEALVVEYAKKSGTPQRAIADQEILERCLYAMVNEGAKIVEEGIALRASDLDVVWVNGYGWPVYRGGPMHWADGIGLPKVLASVQGYERALGPAWKPAALLTRLASEGKSFTR